MHSKTRSRANHSTPKVRARRRTYVYVVECRDGSFYTGLTIDVKKRLDQHTSGKGARYTRSRLPIKLIHVETCTSLSAALKRERSIKKMSRGLKEALVSGARGLPKKFRVL